MLVQQRQRSEAVHVSTWVLNRVMCLYLYALAVCVRECVLLLLQKDLADNLEFWAVTPDIPATNPLTEKAGDFR